jgi:hypothetical protein
MIDSQKLVTRAALRINPSPRDPEELADLRTALNAHVAVAIKRLCTRTADDAKNFRSLQKDFAGTVNGGGGIVNGLCDLTSAEFDGILFRPARVVVKVAGETLNAIPSSFELMEAKVLPDDRIYFCLLGLKLQFQNKTDQSLTSLTNKAVTITANFVATLQTMPDELEDALMEVLVEQYLSVQSLEKTNADARELAEGRQGE